ncbi:MAG: hypothetical protein IJX71_05965 [Oscillospiraceae bacterium]|nr:hypothetical protein [Oscillospiraceae bacterium]
MPNLEEVVTVRRLSRFWDKVMDYIAEHAGGITNALYAQKSIEAQPDMIYDATSDDGVTYTATIPGITQLYAGLKITVKLSRNSASTAPKLNVNGLGAKYIRQPLSTNNASTAVAGTASWLYATVPVELYYNGSMWTTRYARPSATYLYGKVPIASGGTGADNAADALTNLGAASKEYVDQQIAALRALIEGQ